MLCMHDPIASMKMTDEHVDKRPRLADDHRPMWPDPRERGRPDRYVRDRFEGDKLPSMNTIIPDLRQAPQSPVYPPPHGHANGYPDHSPRPPSAPGHLPPPTAPRYAHPHLSQSEHAAGVKRESGSSNGMQWSAVNNPKPHQPYQSQSPMSAPNGHHQNSPQSYTSPPSYETSNGNITGTQPYPSQPVGIPSPITAVSIPPRQSFDHRVDPSPTLPPSADGLLYNSHNGFAIPTPTAGKKKAQRASQVSMT